uniref:Silicon transporter alpha n=1 Tax=Savillea parva TaxID=1909275 RepID=A0A1D8RAE0_9EUKA|nr:silicon transporter alpha [Savillea parva]
MSKTQEKYESSMDTASIDDVPPPSDFSNHAFTIAWRKMTYVWSTLLLIFAMVVHIYGIAKQWNNPPWSQTYSHPVLEILFFLFMCSWIGLLEGCQISLVGLQGIDLEKYKHSHPRAYAALKVCHSGPNVERFLVGRQFLLLFNGFLLSKVAGAGTSEFYIGDWHWSSEANDFFWSNSALLMVLIAAFAQLPTQLLAAQKMLGFLNLPFFSLYTIVYPCLIVESVGLTHSTYLLKDFLVRITGIDRSQADPAKQMNKNFLYYARCALSVAAVIFSFVFIVKGLAMKQTNATEGVGWSKLPGWAAVLCSLFFLYLIACSEGMQVSALALAKVPSHEYKQKSPLAYRTTQLFYAGRNMQAFLVGRQFTVAMMIVLLSRVTSYAGSEGKLIGTGEDWGMGEGFNAGLLQTGFLGAILVVNVGQLASQVAASIFPVACINNYVMNFLLRFMLFIEFSGIVNSCWVLTWCLDAITGLPLDPFDGDETVDTPANNIIDRKKSMGIPQTKGVGPFDLNQPEQEFHIEYTYKVAYV